MKDLVNKTQNLDPKKPIFPISIVAEILEVHQRTLRIYDEIDLLKPSRSAKNRRLYSFDDIEKGKFIQFLTKDLGINITGVRIIISLLEELEVPAEKYIQHIELIAKDLNITPEMQEQNRIKLSKRGRKKKEKL
jgi:MerR family transcriptional regulator/heat shock protein HspR